MACAHVRSVMLFRELAWVLGRNMSLDFFRSMHHNDVSFTDGKGFILNNSNGKEIH